MYGEIMRKKSTAVIDTNIIIRFLTGEPEDLFQKSRRIIENIESGDIEAHLSEAVFAEVVFVLSRVYHIERASIHDALLPLLSMRGLRFQDTACFQKALEIFRDTKLDIVDSILAAYKSVKGMEILTFDNELLKKSR